MGHFFGITGSGRNYAHTFTEFVYRYRRSTVRGSGGNFGCRAGYFHIFRREKSLFVSGIDAFTGLQKFTVILYSANIAEYIGVLLTVGCIA